MVFRSQEGGQDVVVAFSNHSHYASSQHVKPVARSSANNRGWQLSYGYGNIYQLPKVVSQPVASHLHANLLTYRK